MRRRGDTHRMVRWLWTSRRPDARLARLALLPVSGLWRGAMAARGMASQLNPMSSRTTVRRRVQFGNSHAGKTAEAS